MAGSAGSAGSPGTDSQRMVKGLDVIDLVKVLRTWRKVNDNREIPGLHPDDKKFFEHARILPSSWYPLDAWLRLLDRVHILWFGGTKDGMVEMGRISARNTYTGPYARYIKSGDVPETLRTFVRQIGSHHNFGAWSMEIVDRAATMKVADYDEIPELHGTLYLGWFEVIIELAGARMTNATIRRAPWRGDPDYELHMVWASENAPAPRPMTVRTGPKT